MLMGALNTRVGKDVELGEVIGRHGEEARMEWSKVAKVMCHE